VGLGLLHYLVVWALHGEMGTGLVEYFWLSGVVRAVVCLIVYIEEVVDGLLSFLDPGFKVLRALFD
jgi:hypothetical protein